MEKNGRLLSIDALRGFDMLLITGLGPVLCSIAGLAGLPWLADQTQHVPWIGLHMEDLIFPTFLFLAGVSWPFSLVGQLARGKTKGQISLRIVKRMAVLFALGLVCSGILTFDFANVRYISVLGRIGIAWGVAALATLFFRPRICIALAATLLIGYWALLYFPPMLYAPGENPFALDVCVVRRFDLWVWPGHLIKDIWGTEWILATIGAVGTALLGTFAGMFVRREDIPGVRKSLGLAAGGAICLALGVAALPVCPCIKNAWTSSFVLIAGGIALLLLALFHYLIDVRGFTKWSFFFRVIGMNAIAIYMLQWGVGIMDISQKVFGGFAALCDGPEWRLLVLRLGYIACGWSVLYFLYRKKIFIKV